MQVTAKLRYLRIAPRKVRLVADLIRNKSTEEAQNILNFTTKRAVTPLLKLLKQASANAKNNFQVFTTEKRDRGEIEQGAKTNHKVGDGKTKQNSKFDIGKHGQRCHTE